MKKGTWNIGQHRSLALIVFLNGALIMSIEIVGARTIAPYFGTSTYVWTAVIGVILGALALGYWQGGILADKSATSQGLQRIFLVASLILAISVLLQSPILNYIADNIPSLRVQSALAALVLFAPVTFYLGMVSPYVAKLALKSLKNGGEIIGKLYALGTFGSIAGTFLTGYFLLNMFGNKQLYWFFVGVCLMLAFTSYPVVVRTASKHSFYIGLALILGLTGLSFIQKPRSSALYVKDTAYATYIVEDTIYRGKPTRLLITDNSSAQSGMLINTPNTPAFPYINSLLGVVKALPAQQKDILLIGGGTYTFPTIVNAEVDNVSFDVVEIDPGLDNIAVDYFGYTNPSNVNIIHEDGRTYINKNVKKYDLIILDAFNSIRPPFHLMTDEAVEQMAQSLKPEGLIASNVIASLDGGRSEFLASVVKTVGDNLSNVGIYKTSEVPSSQIQNILLIASNNQSTFSSVTSGFDSLDGPTSKAILLTDNYAPTERLLGDL